MPSLLLKLILPLLLGAVVLAEDPYYTIFPKDSGNQEANDRVTNDLYGKIDKAKIHHSTSKSLGTLYWYVPLSDTNRDHYSNFDEIRVVSKTGEYGVPSLWPIKTTKRRRHLLAKRAITSQKPAPSHLRVITQGPGQKLSDVDGYYYDDTAAKDIRVYVIDSGLCSEHKEFASTEVDWRFSGPFGPTEKSDSDQSTSHGTCMASLAIGAQDGVSKKSKLTVVKTSREPHMGHDVSAERGIDALAQVYDSVSDGNQQGKAVVSMAWGFNPPANKDYDSALRDTYTFLLNKLIKDLDVPGLVSAGDNAFSQSEPNAIPALLGKDNVPDLIVVGGVDSDGNHLDYLQRADWMKVSAPGEAVECALKDNNYGPVDGTSPATAMTAGLVAYFMSKDGLSGADARKKLYDTAYKRTDKGPLVVWNEGKLEASTASVPMEPAPPAPKAPFAEGICRFELTQFSAVKGGEMTISMKMFDNAGTEIGSLLKAVDSKTMVINSKLDGWLLATVNGSNGDAEFEYGQSQKWKMDKSDGVPSCNVGQWEGESRTSYTSFGISREMECKFECKWAGFKSTDGS